MIGGEPAAIVTGITFSPKHIDWLITHQAGAPQPRRRKPKASAESHATVIEVVDPSDATVQIFRPCAAKLILPPFRPAHCSRQSFPATSISSELSIARSRPAGACPMIAAPSTRHAPSRHALSRPRERRRPTWLAHIQPWSMHLEGDASMHGSIPPASDPNSDRALVETIDQLIADATATWQTAIDAIATLDAEQAALGHHPHYAAYIMGGMLVERGFAAGHILAVLGTHALDWREVLERLAAAPAEADADSADLLLRLRTAYEADPMLAVAGEHLAGELGLLQRGHIDPFWLKRPKFGLGQAALAFELTPDHADGHRGLYALPLAVLRRGFENAAVNDRDQRFGALLVPVIAAGGDRLARRGGRLPPRRRRTVSGRLRAVRRASACQPRSPLALDAAVVEAGPPRRHDRERAGRRSACRAHARPCRRLAWRPRREFALHETGGVTMAGTGSRPTASRPASCTAYSTACLTRNLSDRYRGISRRVRQADQGVEP